MATVPPIICAVPDPEDEHPDESQSNGQNMLPGFWNLPKCPSSSNSSPRRTPRPFSFRLRTGQKYEAHLLGYLQSQYPQALFLPARSDQFNGAPYLHGHQRTLIQPDITLFEVSGISWWECKFRHGVHVYTDAKVTRREVSVSLRHWKHYWRLWQELCYPFYLVFAIARQDVVVYAHIEALATAITIINPKPFRDASGTVYFDYNALQYLMPLHEFVKY